MDSFALLFYPIGLILGLYLAFRRKKGTEVVYSPLDRVSIVLNLLLIPVYGLFSFMAVLLGMIIYPTASANVFQTVLCWLLSGVIAAAPVYCAIALGLSVSLRRQGNSRKGFWVQFAGIWGIVIPVVIAVLAEKIDAPWINTMLN